MNKTPATLLILAVVLLGAFPAHAQDGSTRRTETHLSAMAHFGATFGYARWSFTGLPDAPVTPGMSIGAAAVYGPVLNALGDMIFVSIETGKGTMSASYKSDTGSADWSMTRYPAMAWCGLHANTRLSPFVRLGAGVSYTNFQESYSYAPSRDMDFGQWSFTWGISGGMNYAFSEKIDLALFIEDWITEQALLSYNQAGIRRGISGHFTVTNGGLRVTAHL